MKRMDFEELVELGGFEEAMRNLQEEDNCITTYEILKDFAIEKIKEDNIHLACHILKALEEADSNNNRWGEWSDYFYYDYSSGTITSPKMLSTIDDVAEHVGFED